MLPAVGVILYLAWAVHQGARFSTATLLADPIESKHRPVGSPSSASGQAGADRAGVGGIGDFRGRAESLKSEINADRDNAWVYQERIRELLADWAASDPEAALSYALSSYDQDPVERLFFDAADAALTTWARQHPERARRYVEQQARSPRWAAELGPSMARAYTAVEPGKGREWVDRGFEDDSGELRPVIANELVLILCELNREDEVGQWLSARQVAECAYAQQAAGTFAGQLALSDIKDALAFTRRLPRGSMSRGLALQRTLQVWTMRNADEAFQWITATSATEQLVTSLSSVLPDEENPAAGHTPDDLDHAVSGYILGLGKISQKGALESLKSIVNPSLQQRIANDSVFGESE